MEPIWVVAAAGAVVLVVILLLLYGRGRERVIDMGGPAAADDETPARPAAKTRKDPAVGAQSAGEILGARGIDEPECGLANWLMDDASKALGVEFNNDHTAMTRLADAALKASAELKSTGRASVELPFLFADASGPKHYRREVTREEAEPGMIHHSALLVDELLQWRGRDEPTVALGEWLEAEADDDAGDDAVDPVSVQRLANAAEQAMADLQRAGQAVVDLPDMKTLEGGVFNFHRELDREKLDDIMGGS